MTRRPNILWIVTTQWRGQACGYAGDPNARTPHLDAFAATATDFRQAVTPHPFGPFARAALLTGVPSPENGVRDYYDPLPPGRETIAHRLRAAGYATAFFGKWHLAQRDPRAPLVGETHARMIVPPAARGGFEVWDGFEGGFQLNDPWLHGWKYPTPHRETGYQSDVVCARAAEYVRGAGAGRPWFVVASLEPPHPPYAAPAAGVAPRDPGSLMLPANVPRGGELEAKVRRELAGYHAHLEATDRAIGRELLAAAGEDAMVVFTSVHGDMHGAHGLFRKGWPHEESIRVPLLVRWPAGARPPGAGRSDAAVSLLDLHRWTLAGAGGESTGPIAPPFQQISMPSVVALPHQCDRVWRGVRTPRRKLVLGPDDRPWLCFDLAADPGELRNLAGDPAFAGELAELRAQVGRTTPG